MPALHAAHRQPIAALWYNALGGIAMSVFILLVVSIFAAGGGTCSGEGCGFLSPVVLTPLMAFVILIVLIYPVLYWYLFSYQLEEHAIVVNSGILFRQYETIDFGRIQTIDNERGPLLWLFGLTMIKIWTASADQVSFNMHGASLESHPHPDTMLILGAPEAEEIRKFITNAKSGTGL